MAVKRKGISKTVRFEVFKRDGFTCVYCGKKPPEVMLVIDHIVPVIAGGDNEMPNLVAACQGCNAGKSDKPVGAIIARPDTAMITLELEQEVQELLRFREVKEQHAELMESITYHLLEVWDAWAMQSWSPHEKRLARMVEKYGPFQVEEAVKALAGKVIDGKVSRDQWEPYTWGILRTMENERGG
jgi:hypothetical protein